MFRVYNGLIRETARKLRKEMTPWERHLWYDFLSGYPVKFYRQRQIGNFVVDFFARKAMLVIELDGGGHYVPEQAEYDKQRTKWLNQLGIEVLRFSNADIDTNFYGVCSVIDEKVKQRVEPTPPHHVLNPLRQQAGPLPPVGDADSES